MPGSAAAAESWTAAHFRAWQANPGSAQCNARYLTSAEDLVPVDPTYEAQCTFADGEKAKSMGRITIPSFVADISGVLTFAGLARSCPALFGMGRLRALGFRVGFEMGRCVVKSSASRVYAAQAGQRPLGVRR
ncbi:unnamed protein product [Prorocentrum cordatum]|uniref:Uncharacterized protein n=1 Tax=Prorocentrum cordatum TaxID=2364126 RepID=A0ABN9XBU6_9DINO|nr:unnamed protein product [Polarella glacialis]